MSIWMTSSYTLTLLKNMFITLSWLWTSYDWNHFTSAPASFSSSSRPFAFSVMSSIETVLLWILKKLTPYLPGKYPLTKISLPDSSVLLATLRLVAMISAYQWAVCPSVQGKLHPGVGLTPNSVPLMKFGPSLRNGGTPTAPILITQLTPRPSILPVTLATL